MKHNPRKAAFDQAPGPRLVERVHSISLFMALGLAGEAQRWGETENGDSDNQ